jgi:hypothetical protein
MDGVWIFNQGTASSQPQNWKGMVAGCAVGAIENPVDEGGGTHFTVTCPLWLTNNSGNRWTGNGEFEVVVSFGDETIIRKAKSLISFSSATVTVGNDQFEAF